MTANLKKKISSVFLILIVSAIAELLTNVILGRVMPQADFGRFKFINTVVITLGTLLLFGQNTAIIKVVGKGDFTRYNWKRFISICVGVAGTVGVVAIAWVGWFYHLTYEIGVIYCVFLASIVVEFLSSVLRSRDSYIFSMFLTKSASISLFLGIALLFFLFHTIHFLNLLWIYILAAAIPLFIGMFVIRNVENGGEILPKKVVKEGLFLSMITISFVILGQVDQFFIAKMLGYESLAGYSVVITVMRGFDLVAMALWFVLMPYYAKETTRSVRNDAIKAGWLALGMCILYILFGQFILHILFKGKFDTSEFLIPFFIIIGFCKIIYAIPSGIIGGRMPAEYLKIFLGVSMVGIIINIAGNYFLIPVWGLKGSATATMVSWIFRVCSAYWLVNISAQQRKSSND